MSSKKEKGAVAPVKKHNPEAALLASVAKDARIRQMEDHARRQQDDFAKALWDSNLGKKGALAERNRIKEAVRAEEKLTKAAVKTLRQQKLVELFSREDQEYEAELESLGLSFRRDRT